MISSYVNTKREVIIGDPYKDNVISYLKRQKDLKSTKFIALGSSRVLQFSQAMFEDEFFNMGYTTSSIFQMTQLIKDLKICNKTLIVGLDQWCFNPNYPDAFTRATKTYDFNGFKYFVKSIFNEKRNIDIIQGKVFLNFSNSDNVDLVGTGAVLALNGMMNDGSFYYGKVVHGKLHGDKELIGEDYGFADTKNRISTGTQRFEYSDQIAEEAFSGFVDFVAECKSRNNRIVIFFPPFAPTVAQLMKHSGHYKYIDIAAARVSELCSKETIPFFDFTHFRAVDEEFLDGFHGGQLVYYKIAIELGLPVRKLKFLNSFENEEQMQYAKLREAFFRE